MKMMMKGLLAATALVSLPSMANAAVVVSNVNIAVPATTAGVYINLVTGLSGTNPGAVPGWDINPWGTGSLFFYTPPSAGVVVSTGAVAASLAAGTVIGAGSSFNSAATGGAFLTSGDRVFGFSFLNENTGIVNYGYARITTTTGVNGRPAAITQLVYENTGASLTVAAVGGAVPEPATWGMMILGFGMIGAAARKRSGKTTVKFA